MLLLCGIWGRLFCLQAAHRLGANAERPAKLRFGLDGSDSNAVN